jgi:large repetitive protein
VAAVPGGYVIVWHADGLDGSLLGVFGQRLDASGKLIGTMFRANSTTAHDQRDPAIAADSAGNTVVVWSSYGQDGDLGGIYGQLFDVNGRLAGNEFQVNSVTAGHQAKPQVAYLPGGGFVVGWTTEAIGDNPGALSLRVFARNGSPLIPEIRIPGSPSLHPELVDLQSGKAGGFSLRWLLRADTRATAASYLQQFTAEGTAIAAPVTLP